jgi:hypothetical protein
MSHEWPYFFRRHPFRNVRPVLLLRGLAIELEPQERLIMSLTMSVSQTDALSIAYLDQNGKPMATPPTPDSAPTWSDTTPATETLTVADGGLTAELAALEAGTDTVNLTVVVAGQTFTAQLDVTVEGQVLTSVEIVPGTPV